MAELSAFRLALGVRSGSLRRSRWLIRLIERAPFSSAPPDLPMILVCWQRRSIRIQVSCLGTSHRRSANIGLVNAAWAISEAEQRARPDHAHWL